MKNKSYRLLPFFILLSCNPSPTQKKHMEESPYDTIPGIMTKKMDNLFWGVDDKLKLDTANPIESAMYFLNKSKFSAGLTVLRTKYNLDIAYYSGGFHGIKEKESVEANKLIRYTYFRFNDYSNPRIVGGELYNQLSLVDTTEKLYHLQEVEAPYIGIKEDMDSLTAEKLVPLLKKLNEKYGNAKRLEFMLASEYLLLNDTIKAMSIFDRLIGSDYYALCSLRALTASFSDKSPLLMNKYSALLDRKFPDECNFYKARSLLATIKEDSMVYECKKCFQSVFQADSIYARLLLSKFYMFHKSLGKVDSLVNGYLKIEDGEPFNDDRKYIKGVYYDFKLRTLFLRGRYYEMQKFAEKKIRDNPVVQIDSDADLNRYVKNLYLQYISSETKDFGAFYEKNFSSQSGAGL